MCIIVRFDCATNYHKRGISNGESYAVLCGKQFIMEQFTYSLESNALFFEEIQNNQQVLIERIKHQHRLILDKLLPEIDLHFTAVSKQKSPFDETLLEAHKAFCKFSELLTDHIYMEDHIVFPELVLEEKPMVSAIRDFVEHHDNFEALIQELLNHASASLKPLQELLPFRILLLKMERLKVLLAEHNELEDLLFADFH